MHIILDRVRCEEDNLRYLRDERLGQDLLKAPGLMRIGQGGQAEPPWCNHQAGGWKIN